MAKRYSIKEIQEKFNDLFENNSPIQISESYVYENRNSIIGYTCPEYGDEVYEVEASFLLSRLKRRNINRDYTPQMKKDSELNKYKQLVINKYGSFPYEVLSEYVDAKTPLKLRCIRCNNITKTIRPNHLKAYSRNDVEEPPCTFCMAKRMSESKRFKDGFNLYMNELSEHFPNEDDQYEIIFENEDDKKDFMRHNRYLHKCNRCEYEWLSTPANIINEIKNKNRRVCPSCNDMIRDEIPFLEWLSINKSEFQFMSKSLGRLRDIHVFHCTVCDNDFEAYPYNIRNGSGCHTCNNHGSKVSSVEDTVNEFLTNELKLVENVDFVRNTRKILPSTQELDFHFPKLNLAFEINGLFYHSHRYKEKDYHLNKTKEAGELGIQLIHFSDHLIKNKLEIIKDKIRHVLHKTKKSIYARKCEVRVVPKKDKGIFLNENHVQGNDASSVELGLYHKDELVALMTFCKNRRVNGYTEKNSNYELSRYATLINHSVVGGFSKLFKNSLPILKENDCDMVYTYADKDFSEGNLYTKNGFSHIRDTKPSYFYLNRNTRKVTHRYTFRKDQLKELFPEHYSPDKTEFEIMDSTGVYFRVYNTGNMYFECHIK